MTGVGSHIYGLQQLQKNTSIAVDTVKQLIHPHLTILREEWEMLIYMRVTREMVLKELHHSLTAYTVGLNLTFYIYIDARYVHHIYCNTKNKANTLNNLRSIQSSVAY